MNHLTVHLKLTQYYKLTIVQEKQNQNKVKPKIIYCSLWHRNKTSLLAMTIIGPMWSSPCLHLWPHLLLLFPLPLIVQLSGPETGRVLSHLRAFAHAVLGCMVPDIGRFPLAGPGNHPSLLHSPALCYNHSSYHNLWFTFISCCFSLPR